MRYFCAMKSLKALLFGLLAVVATACGDSGRFSVQGTVEGGKSMNLRYVFYNGNAFAQGITAVRDGRFSFEGATMQPAMMELYDNDYRLLGRLYVANGDEIECTIDPSDPYMLRAAGNDAIERWTRWQRDNASALNAGRADALVEKYVGEHPADVVSTLLLTSLYDTSTPDGVRRADSLLSLIEADARPMNITQSFIAQLDANLHAADTRVRDFKARVLGKGPDTLRVADAALSVYAFSTEHSLRKDSVVPLLRERACARYIARRRHHRMATHHSPRLGRLDAGVAARRHRRPRHRQPGRAVAPLLHRGRLHRAPATPHPIGRGPQALRRIAETIAVAE